MVKNSKILLWFMLAGPFTVFQGVKSAQAEQKEAAANPDLADILSGLSSERGPWGDLSNIIQGYRGAWQTFQEESKMLVDGAIEKFASSPDAQHLAYVLKDGKGVRETVIYVRDMQDLQKDAVVLQGYEGGDLLFSPNGRFLAAKNSAKKVKIWRTSESGAEQDHLVNAAGFFFSPDNKYIVGWSNNKILIYDLTNNQASIQDFGVLKPFSDVQFSLNAIAIHSGNEVLVIDMPKNFNEPLPRAKRFLPTPESSSMIFSADGRYLATWSEHEGFMVWDMEKESKYPLLLHLDKNDSIENVAFSPEGDYFFADVVRPGRHRVDVWNMRSLKPMAKLSDLKLESAFAEDVVFYEPSMTVEGASSPIAFSPNGHDVALVQGLHDLIVRNVQDSNAQPRVIKSPHGIYTTGKLFFSPYGRYLVAKERYYEYANKGNHLLLWDTYNLAKEPIKFNDRIRDVVFSPDDRSMALVTLTGITLYNMNVMQDKIARERFEKEQKIQKANEPASNTWGDSFGKAREAAGGQLQRAQQGVAAFFGSVLQKARELQTPKPAQQPQPSKRELPEAKEQEEKKQVAERVVQEGSAKKIRTSRFDVVRQQQARERAQAQEIRKQQETGEKLRKFKERAAQRGQASMADMLLNLSNKDLLGRLFPKQEPVPKQEPEPKQERAHKRPMPSRFDVVQQQKERERLEAERIREQDGQ